MQLHVDLYYHHYYYTFAMLFILIVHKKLELFIAAFLCKCSGSITCLLGLLLYYYYLLMECVPHYLPGITLWCVCTQCTMGDHKILIFGRGGNTLGYEILEFICCYVFSISDTLANAAAVIPKLNHASEINLPG